MGKTRIAIAGAGLIGKRHAVAIQASRSADLAAIADPTDAGREFAESLGAPWFASLDETIAAGIADGMILATPNQMHVEGGLACVKAGLPALVEKPIGVDAASARALVEAAEAAGVPLMTGHHRRHNPLIAKAREIVASGDLGTIATIQAQTWLMKPDDYFDAEWRRRKGAGPVFLNLIHDIDLMRYFCGDIVSVHAMDSNAVRGNEVEETAVILLRFASGTLGTVNLTDTVPAPWSWELTARENPAYPATSENCYWIGGTKASLALPNLAIWSNAGKRSWWEPISATRMRFEFEDPLIRQADQFAAVIRGEEPPLVSGRDGLKALEVIEAVKTSAAEGRTVEIAGDA